MRPAVPPDIAAEAAVWVARLHGPGRSKQMERECLAWQARSAAHREAFERCTETWQDVPRVTLASAYETASGQAASGSARNPWRNGSLGWAFAFTVMAVVGVVALQQWREAGTYGTGVGEQQLVVLDDGSRVSLNTDTRVRVALGPDRRTVSVLTGEALFEVAKDARRPFVVRVGGSEVEALGTVFAVRFSADGSSNDEALAVTLIEGSVSVGPASTWSTAGPAPARRIVMLPGERLRLAKAAAGTSTEASPRVDRPNVQQAVAWKRNEVVFDDVSVEEAVAEMNRYSRTPVVLLLHPAGLTNLRVSGLFRTGDNAGFARAVAALHGLKVRERAGRLELAKAH
jgi:transmembrane sensor